MNVTVRLLISMLWVAAVGCDAGALKAEGDECFASSECDLGLTCDFGVSPPVCSTGQTRGPDVPPDAAVVVPAPDAAALDATPAPDAPDAVPDAAVPDAAVPDAAIPDAAVPDAAVPDAAVPDAA